MPSVSEACARRVRTVPALLAALALGACAQSPETIAPAPVDDASVQQVWPSEQLGRLGHPALGHQRADARGGHHLPADAHERRFSALTERSPVPTLLSEQGLRVARRTITKYRTLMRVPSVEVRRTLGRSQSMRAQA